MSTDDLRRAYAEMAGRGGQARAGGVFRDLVRALLIEHAAPDW
ncbi:hypothetical protein [Bradyrhizobium sp. USDA 4452]